MKIKVPICIAKGIILALVRDHPAIVFSYKERLTSLSKMPSATRSAARQTCRIFAAGSQLDARCVLVSTDIVVSRTRQEIECHLRNPALDKRGGHRNKSLPYANRFVYTYARSSAKQMYSFLPSSR